MKRLIAVVAVVLACAACQSGGTSSENIDDIETTLNSVEADLDQS